jgi:zinc/manganese transport system substrate-binding protein
MRRAAAVLALLTTVGVVGPAPAWASGSSRPRVLQVVAAENFWGSIARQLGGRWVSVTSVVSDPNTDPHEYEASPADARRFAAADYVIVNGLGYDTWAGKLLAAQPHPGRRVLTVATYLRRPKGADPHLWYDPFSVFAVLDKITADYEALEPAERAYFASRHHQVLAAFSTYRSELSSLRRHDAGTRVASTESIFVYLARYLGLRLVTPPSFMDAVAEGIDPPASAIATVESQVSSRAFGVLVYNSQTVTPLTTSIRASATSKRIPVVAISETMQPPTTTFERWMVGELERLGTALARARR